MTEERRVVFSIVLWTKLIVSKDPVAKGFVWMFVCACARVRYGASHQQVLAGTLRRHVKYILNFCLHSLSIPTSFGLSHALKNSYPVELNGSRLQVRTHRHTRTHTQQ